MKAEVFRYLVTKTVSEDEATNKYQETLEGEEISEVSQKEAEEKQAAKGDSIDTTTIDSKEPVVAEVSNDIPEDLTKIEGIGPKIQEALYMADVKTFTKLANKTAEEISEIITGVRGSHDTATWPEQSVMAADGKWDELKD
jgi:predicted flap endonuclease-1-like 5' DNA nuclease